MIASAANVALKAPFSVSSTASPSSKRSPMLASPRVSRALGVVYAASELPGSGVEKEGPNFAPLKDIQAIMQILPHRYPFLLVDRVLEWEYASTPWDTRYVSGDVVDGVRHSVHHWLIH